MCCKAHTIMLDGYVGSFLSSKIPSYLIITRKGGQEKQFIESSLPLSRCKPPSSCLTVMAFLAATFSKSAQTPASLR